jgi:hypothetical protein
VTRVAAIDRERPAIVSTRTALHASVARFLSSAAGNMAAQITAARDAAMAEKSTASAGVALRKDDASDGGDELSAAEVDAIVEQVEASLDFTDWDALRSELEPMLIQITQDGVRVAFEQIGVEPTADMLDQVNERALAWAKDRAAEMVGMTVNDDGDLVPSTKPRMAITDSTRDMLRSDIAQAVEEGTSTAALADQLAATYAFSDTRAERIARFETAQADVQGNLAAYDGSGVVEGKEVILGSEHDEPDECDDAADMGVVPLDSDFGGNGDAPFHPNCFLGGTRVSAAGVSAHFRRWYEGKVVVIRVAGQDLAATPNHPILTRRGWVAIGALQVGDDVMQCVDPAVAVRLLDPDDHHVETPIEEIARALRIASRVSARRVPTAAEHFHGDGVTDGEVDVVRPARALVSERVAHPAQYAGDPPLGAGHRRGRGFATERAGAELLGRVLDASDGLVRGGRAARTFAGGQGGVVDDVRRARVAYGQAGAFEDVAQRAAVTTESLREIDGRGAAQILGVERSDVAVAEPAPPLVDLATGAELDAGGTEASLHDVRRHADPARDRLDRLARLIGAAQITEVRQFDFAGHVYNLSTRDQWYFAAGIIAHNCVCDVLPVLAGESDDE